MIRVIVRTDHIGLSVHGGGTTGCAEVEYRTFDVDLPELEMFLRESRKMTYSQRQVIGVELCEGRDG